MSADALEALGDFAAVGERADDGAGVVFDDGEGHFDVEFGAIGAAGAGGEGLAAVFGFAGGECPVVAFPVSIAELLGDDEVEVAAEGSCGGVAEHGFSGGVPNLDDSVGAGEDDGVGGLLQQAGGQGLVHGFLPDLRCGATLRESAPGF